MRRRHGFSLIELMIAMTITAIIGVAFTRLLTSQTRFFAKMSLGRDARTVTRNARNLIQTELSMVEIGGGILAATNDSITVNVPVAWGMYCSSGTMMLLPYDSAYVASATISGFALKDTTALGAYTYTTLTSTGVGTAANCTGGSIQITAPTNKYINLTPVPAGTQASPMFLYQKVTYKFATSGFVTGQRGLWRRVGAGTYAEIVAPFDTSAKFRYYSLYSDTAQTTVPSPVTNIRGVELDLNAIAPRTTPGTTNREATTVKTAVFFRNRTDT